MKNLLRFSFLIIFCVLANMSSAQWLKMQGPEGGYVYALDSIGNQVWIGTTDGIYISSDQGNTWQHSSLINGECVAIYSSGDSIIAVYGEYEDSYDLTFHSISSFDGGSSWTSPALIVTGNQYISVIRAGATCIVDAWLNDYISFDFGQSWSVFNPPDGPHLNGIVSDEHSVLVNSFDSLPWLGQTKLSVDGAHTWLPITPADLSGEMYIERNMMLFGVSDSLNNSYIVRSPDLGVNWDTVYSLPFGEYPGDFYKIDNKIFCGGDPVYASSDDGLTWTPVPWPGTPFSVGTITYPSGDKLGVGVGGMLRYLSSPNNYYSSNSGILSQIILYLGANKNMIFCGTYPYLFRSGDAGNTWQKANIPSYQTGVYDMAFMGDTIYYLDDNQIGRSFDNGNTWDTLSSPENPFQEYSIEVLNKRLFFSEQFPYYSDDFGQTWDSLPQLPQITYQYPCHDPNNDYAGNLKVFDNELYYSLDKGIIFKLDSLAQNWQYLTCFDWGMGQNRLYVMDSCLCVRGATLQCTYDHGLTWVSPALNGLPGMPWTLAANNGQWVASTFMQGVFVSLDHGNNWQALDGSTPPFHAYQSLMFYQNLLWAGSRGSGLWRRAGTFESISGTVYSDNNNNGIKDSMDLPLPGMLVHTIPTYNTVSSDSSGKYTYITDITGDTLLLTKPCPYIQINPSFYITNGADTNLDFGLFMPPGIADLAIDICNVSTLNPGFQTQVLLTASNFGSLRQPAEIHVTMDTNVVFSSSSLTPTSVNGNILTFITDTIDFLDTRTISLVVGTKISAVIGDSAHFYAVVMPVIHDTVPTNNYSNIGDIIRGSYDPNDKQCLQGAYITPAQVQNGEDLVFIIRFQNTGNYPTSFIHIIDTLSPYLDLSSFRVLSSSHPMTWTLNQDNVVDFFFANTAIPPSSTDELNSHGFVKYSVKCKKGVNLGNAVTNKAYIYFDYNPAIITNSTVTLVVNPFVLAIPGDQSNGETNIEVKVFPNPTSGQLFIELPQPTSDNLKLSVFTTAGQLIRSTKLTGGINEIQMGEYPAGIYIGRITNSATGYKSTFRFVLSK